MSQFDETTERLGEKFVTTGSPLTATPKIHKYLSYSAGRNSTKASMEELARAADEISIVDHDTEEALATVRYDDLMGLFSAIAQVKANGDWPLEEEEMRKCTLCGELVDLLVMENITEQEMCKDCKESTEEHIGDFVDEEHLP